RTEMRAVHDLVRDLSALFGDGRALDAIRAVALDNAKDTPARRAALRSLIDGRAADLAAVCQKLYFIRDLAATAAEGLALSDDPAQAEFMIKNYGQLYHYERSPAMSALVSRPAWAAKVLDAVADKRLARTDITAFHARQIHSYNDPKLDARLREVWGEVRDTGGDKLAQIAKWKERLSPATLAKADRAKGHATFVTICGTCHLLYGEGKAIGPDLTGSGRDNIDYLLQNIVDPSAVVPAEYRFSTLEMKDGRALTGIVKSRTDKIVSLQTINESVNLDTGDIRETKQSQLSLMPEGLLDAMDEAQARDLIAFLMSRDPPAK
ncbi:MAG TPA: c-type cytochrome, partial [Verrucomicrobiae bacterium]|nr:c-type cytochrome [Verrucomicrobiae bacterium]